MHNSQSLVTILYNIQTLHKPDKTFIIVIYNNICYLFTIELKLKQSSFYNGHVSQPNSLPMDKYESNIVYSLAMDIRRGMFCISMASWVKAHKGQHMMVIQSLMVDPSIPFCSRILPRMFTHSMMLRMGTKYARPETFEMHVTVL